MYYICTLLLNHFVFIFKHKILNTTIKVRIIQPSKLLMIIFSITLVKEQLIKYVNLFVYIGTQI
jgi:hypothetical protein